MAYLVSFCPFLCIGNLCLPSSALFHKSQKSQWQRVIGRPMPFFAGLHFDISYFFLSVHAFSDDLPLLHNEGWKDLRKALLELKMWWCLTDQLPVGIFDLLLENNSGGSSFITVRWLQLPSKVHIRVLSPHNFAIVSTFARPQVGSDCISASLSLYLTSYPSKGIILLKASW